MKTQITAHKVLKFKKRTNFRIKATVAVAGPGRASARRAVHICRRSADIADCAAKIIHSGDSFHLFQDGVQRPALNNPALVAGQGTEGAPAAAATVAGDGSFNGRKRRHAGHSFIGRMACPGKGKVVYAVKFRGCKR